MYNTTLKCILATILGVEKVINVLDLRHSRCVCNIQVQCKEVKNTTSLLSVIMLLIKQHVSVYSEAIIRFNKETNIFHGNEWLDVEISSSMLV